MASFNRVILMGNLTRDVEPPRRTKGGIAVTDVGLAVNERVKRNDEWVDEVNFFDVTLWGRTAEVAAEYLNKGSAVLIEGRLKYETWTQESDGSKRSKVKVVGEKMQMLGGKSGGQSGSPQGSDSQGSAWQSKNSTSDTPAPASTPAPATPPPGDDVPF